MIETLCIAAEIVAALLAVSIMWNPIRRVMSDQSAQATSDLQFEPTNDIELDNAIQRQWSSHRDQVSRFADLFSSDPEKSEEYLLWLEENTEHHVKFARRALYADPNDDRIDKLTKVLTRDALLESIETERTEANRSGALLLCDVDELRQFNDEHGMSMGDLAIRQIGGNLFSHFADIGLIGRFSGGRFVIWLPSWNLDQIQNTIARRRSQASRIPIQTGNTEHQFTIAGAIVHLTQDADIDSAIEQLEEGFLEAKLLGLDCLTSFNGETWNKVDFETESLEPITDEDINSADDRDATPIESTNATNEQTSEVELKQSTDEDDIKKAMAEAMAEQQAEETNEVNDEPTDAPADDEDDIKKAMAEAMAEQQTEETNAANDEPTDTPADDEDDIKKAMAEAMAEQQAEKTTVANEQTVAEPTADEDDLKKAMAEAMAAME